MAHDDCANNQYTIPMEEALLEPEMGAFKESEEVKKMVASVAPVVQTIVEQTEKNAVDVTASTAQVLTLAGHEQYIETIKTIFNDPTLSTEEKLELKAMVDKRQDVRNDHATQEIIRLQDSQQKGIIQTIKSWTKFVFLGAGGISSIFLCRTESGRKILNQIVTLAVKEIPKLTGKDAA